MNRRRFLGSSTLAAASVMVGGPFANLLAQDTRGLSATAVVKTTLGSVRGVVRENRVNSFWGIPYGGSTAGAGRFMPPTKAASWTGVKDTVMVGNKAPQAIDPNQMPEMAATDRNEPMSEDCLFLNVHSPLVGNGRRPVMVWLHGGGFTTGTGGRPAYDGVNLSQKEDVVVVTVNHRLNIFGYLYLSEIGGEKFANGSNAGMRDIVLALEWVRDNIAAFGGDPGNVTIFGQSGGGGKVSTLAAMPSAMGLFHRAIMMSGSAVTGASRADATKGTEALLAKLGLRPNQIEDLQRVPFQQLIMAMGEVRELRLSPVVDGTSLPTHAWDPRAPELSATVPMMFGTTETEATWQGYFPPNNLSEADLRTRVKQSTRGTDAQVEELIAVYRKGRPGITNTDVDLIIATDMGGFRTGVLTQLERKAEQARAAAYSYYFTWRTPVRGGVLKAIHTLDIPFVFDTVDITQSMTGFRQDRYALADKMRAAFAAFARTGNPSTRESNWPAFTMAQRATMVFGDQSRVVSDPYGDERKALSAIRRQVSSN